MRCFGFGLRTRVTRRLAALLVLPVLLLGRAVPGWADPAFRFGSPALTFCDAENEIGLVADDSSDAVAAENTARLNAAMEAMHPGGMFAFRNLPPGSVLLPIHVAAKRFYFKGQLRNGLHTGGELEGTGGGTPAGQNDFTPNGTIGQQTQFIRIDPDPKDYVFLVRGNGMTLSKICFCGHKLPGNINSGYKAISDATNTSPIVVTAKGHALLKFATGDVVSVMDVAGNTAANGEWTITVLDANRFSLDGSKGNGAYVAGGRAAVMTGCGIGIEGREYLSTGKHTFRDCSIVDCNCAIRFLNGYYDDDNKFVVEETHADDTVWDRIFVFGCKIGVQSFNNQAVWHEFRRISFQTMPSDAVLFDIVRGGLYKIGFLGIGGVPSCTIFRFGHGIVHDGPEGGYSFNSGRIDCYVYRDGSPANLTQRLTFVKWAEGGAATDSEAKKWSIRFTGNLSNHTNVVALTGNLLELGKHIPSDDIWFDVTGLDLAPAATYRGYHWDMAGPWRRLLRN